MAALRGISVLGLTAPVAGLARALVAGHAVPATAAVDAVHIAVAAVNGMDLLLTWNCTHITNAATRGMIERVCRAGASFRP